MWYRRRVRRRRRTSVTKHYLTHKESARAVVHERLEHYNQYYQLKWNRVSIRNQRTCWGSCTSLGNLNFSYRLLFLPPELRDYIIVHELCHLSELNHGKNFWSLVEEQIPDHHLHRRALRVIEQQGMALA